MDEWQLHRIMTPSDEPIEPDVEVDIFGWQLRNTEAEHHPKIERAPTSRYAPAMPIRLPTRCLVVLAGPSAAGKTQWADRNFSPAQVVSSDRLRAIVGTGERDIKASEAAFEVLHTIVEERAARGLLTVVDTLGMDADRRARFRDVGERHALPVYAVLFDASLEECKKRNRTRRDPVPQRVLADQHRRWRAVRPEIAAEPFAEVFTPDDVRIVGDDMLAAIRAGEQQRTAPRRLDFGLQLSSFNWEGHPDTTRDTLVAIAAAAEDAGFSSLWVMDHFRQIPQIGREWDDMLESYTTLSFLAGVTTGVRLGALVTGIGYRNPAHLGKIVATLDVLSGGRAVCGLGIGWFEAEAIAYGWDFPPVAERYALLEDTVELLRQMWGSGNKPYRGRRLTIPDTTCYPRPLQDHVPILIGGSGEKRTLRIVAEHADMANFFGDAATVEHKTRVLHEHCATVGRDPSEVTITHLGPALVARSPDRLALQVERHAVAAPNTTAEMIIERHAAGTVTDHIGRYHDLAAAGVDHAIVTLTDVDTVEPIEVFAEVIAAFT